MPEPSARRGWRPHRYLMFGFLEDLDTTPRIAVGKVLGVPVAVTPTAWIQPPLFFALGVVLTYLPGRLAASVASGDRLVDAFGFAVAGLVANAAHALGHIVSGTLAGSPMDELLVTATRDANRYHGDQSGVPSRTHIARAVGGPVGNLVVAAVAFGALAVLGVGGHPILARTAGVNLAFGLGSFLPVPSVDGEVIWREAWRALRQSRAMRQA